jgi:hypothetical protein
MATNSLLMNLGECLEEDEEEVFELFLLNVFRTC